MTVFLHLTHSPPHPGLETPTWLPWKTDSHHSRLHAAGISPELQINTFDEKNVSFYVGNLFPPMKIVKLIKKVKNNMVQTSELLKEEQKKLSTNGGI